MTEGIHDRPGEADLRSSDIEAARAEVAGTVLRTPLVRLDLGASAPDIRLKLENLQPTNAYKIRGAANAVARLSDGERARGVWTISAGNAGQGVAYAARAAGIPCSVVAIETAPQTKLDRMRALGATIVPVSYEEAWKAAEAQLSRAWTAPSSTRSTIMISSPATAPWGSRSSRTRPTCGRSSRRSAAAGLITGVGSAIKALRPEVRVLGAEPETAAPYAYSLSEGGPRKFPDWQATFVDGAGGQSVTERMWQRMQPVVDGAITVSLDQTRDAMRLMAEKARAIAEGAGALALAAALTGQAGDGPIVCIVSGGNIDLAKFAELVAR